MREAVLVFLVLCIGSAATLDATSVEEELKMMLKTDDEGNMMNNEMKKIMENALKDANKNMEEEKKVARAVRKKTLGPSAKLKRRILKTKAAASSLALVGHIQRALVKLLQRRFTGRISKRGLGKLIRKLHKKIKTKVLQVNPFKHDSECPKTSLFYRTMDGSCNNLHNPLQGKSFTAFRRDVPPDYGDDIMALRTAKSGNPLPNARRVSFTLIGQESKPSHKANFLFVTYAQFIDHDFSLLALSTAVDENGKTIPVECGEDGCDASLADCKPVPIPEDDPGFDNTKQPCLEFVRSAGVTDTDSNPLSQRQQINQLTSAMDGSNTYGSTLEESNNLREKVKDPRTGKTIYGAKLRMRTHPYNSTMRKVLPPDEHAADCDSHNEIENCFLSGDERVNEQAPLITIHTVWAREHNKIADFLKRVNYLWSEEKIFQETRMIIASMMQHIAYNEVLPIILGDDIRDKYGLKLKKYGYYTGYDKNIDLSISNVFATAAYRFGHTLLPSSVHRADKKYDTSAYDVKGLSEMFFQPGPAYDLKQGGIDAMLRGLIKQKSESFDACMTSQVVHSLFTNEAPHGPGMDLAVLNIQRARDHGIPSYNALRRWCNLKPVTSLKDLGDIFNDTALAKKFADLYEDFEDIDLWPGGIAEPPVEGGMAGPTFACIIARQFSKVRDGDRFWYENYRAGGLTIRQLSEIRKTTFARILCDNSDNLRRVPADVMKPISKKNPLKKCDSLPKVNLAAFIDYY